MPCKSAYDDATRGRFKPLLSLGHTTVCAENSICCSPTDIRTHRALRCLINDGVWGRLIGAASGT